MHVNAASTQSNCESRWTEMIMRKWKIGERLWRNDQVWRTQMSQPLRRIYSFDVVSVLSHLSWWHSQCEMNFKCANKTVSLHKKLCPNYPAKRREIQSASNTHWRVFFSLSTRGGVLFRLTCASPCNNVVGDDFSFHFSALNICLFIWNNLWSRVNCSVHKYHVNRNSLILSP